VQVKGSLVPPTWVGDRDPPSTVWRHVTTDGYLASEIDHPRVITHCRGHPVQRLTLAEGPHVERGVGQACHAASSRVHCEEAHA
jgi:hypothetical protein